MGISTSSFLCLVSLLPLEDDLLFVKSEDFYFKKTKNSCYLLKHKLFKRHKLALYFNNKLKINGILIDMVIKDMRQKNSILHDLFHCVFFVFIFFNFALWF